MNNKRTLSTAAAVTVLMLALAACGGGPGAAPSPSPSPSPTVTPAETEPPATQEPQQEVITGTGIYVGQIDNHSVEIETDDGPTAFRLGEGTLDAPEGLEMNDAVVFQYTEVPVEGDDTATQLILSMLAPSGEQGGDPSADLPEVKTFDLVLEGMEEQKEARLAQGDGYALYVFDIYDFDRDTGKLSLIADPGYAVEITQLPSDYNTDYLREEAETALGEIGDISEYAGDDRPQGMEDAVLYLRAAGDGLSREYIVKELDGQGYVFLLDIPHREASEGFHPHVFASLNSIVTQ